MSTVYYVNTVAGKRGPFTLEQIKIAVEKGKLRETSAIAVGETEQWVEARTIPGLFPAPPLDDIDDLPPAVSLDAAVKRTPLPQPTMTLREAIETDNLEQVKRLFAHGISLEAFYGTGDGVTTSSKRDSVKTLAPPSQCV